MTTPIQDMLYTYPGTICEWPEDGPGSGKGPYGHFACKHCGREHGQHGLGLGSQDVVDKLGIGPDDQHRICKIPRYVPISEVTVANGFSPETYMHVRNAFATWFHQQSVFDGPKALTGTWCNHIDDACYSNIDQAIEWQGQRRKIDDIMRSAQTLPQTATKPELESVAPIAAYFTILIPFVPREYATQWHPTEADGPFATLSRGAFKNIGDAIAWAREKLNGTPYSIRLIKTDEGEI